MGWQDAPLANTTPKATGGWQSAPIVGEQKSQVPSRYEQIKQQEETNVRVNPFSAGLSVLANAGNAVPFLDEVISASTVPFGGNYDDMQMRQQALREAGKQRFPTETGISNFAGNVALGAVTPAIKLGGMITSGAATGGLLGGALGLGEGDASKTAEESAQERFKNARNIGAAGAVAGGVLGALAKGLAGTGGGGATPSNLPDNVRDLALKAENEFGIPLKTTQITQNKPLKWAGAVLDELPFSGAENIAGKQASAINKNLARLIGQEADAFTPDVMEAAKSTIGGGLNDINTRNALNVGDDLISRLGDIQQKANRYMVEGNSKPINNILDDLISRVENGKIDGKTYQSFRTELGSMQKSGGEVGHYAGEVKKAIDGAFKSGLSGNDALAAALLRNQYRNMKMIEPLAEKAYGNSGNIQPELLLGRVMQQDPTFAYTGGGEIGDLARIGKQFFSKMPNSGTADRIAMRSAMTNPVSAVASLVAAPATKLANALLNSKSLKNYILGQNPVASGIADTLGTTMNAQTTAANLAALLKERKNIPRIEIRK